MVELRIRSSKTDQLRKGQILRLTKTANSTFCPVNALWYAAKNARKIGLEGSDQLFSFKNEAGKIEALPAAHIDHLLKTGAKGLGLNPTKFSSHSLRIGGTTALFAAGLPANAIKLFGRWKSDCYQVYTRIEHTLLASISNMIAGDKHVF